MIVNIIEIVKSDPFLSILIAYGIVFLVQLVYYLFFYFKIITHSNSKKESKKIREPVSVIICAKNEAHNLAENLPVVLNQSYPDFEVIVVDDCSEDDTNLVLKKLTSRHINLKVTKIKKDPKFSHNKKLALTIGIKAAKNETLLLTDADCQPESDKWIESMEKNFQNKKEIVLGYGGYLRTKGILNALIRFDALFIAMQYLSFALAKKAYMGVGRNLAYKKELFFKNKGFASHANVNSGDDDIFINQVSNKRNTAVELSKESITRSVPENSFYKWLKQKKRHLTSSKFYKRGSKSLIGLEVISRVLFYILFVVSLLLFREYWIFIVSAFAFRLIIQLLIIKLTMIRFNEKFILFVSFFYDIFMPYIIFGLLIANYISAKKNKWK